MAYFLYDNKRVHYSVKGKGNPILMIHGNTASSRMFLTVIKNYFRNYKVILIDLPGQGKSESLPKFKTDFWHYNALACINLLKKLNYGKVNIVGTSGGALIAINIALEAPELVNKIVADSFEGEFPLKSYTENLAEDREKDKRKILAKLFWYHMHGSAWRKVVDADTKANINFYKTGKSFFHKPISELKVPTLVTGSRKDEYCSHLDDIYSTLSSKSKNIKVHLFENGNHPAMISNKKEFFNLVQSFLK